MSEISKVAFLGTGLMGFPMARNLSANGITLSAWNRSAEKAIGLSGFGVHVATSAAEAVNPPKKQHTRISSPQVKNSKRNHLKFSIISEKLFKLTPEVPSQDLHRP